MAVPGTLAVMAGSASVIAIMHGAAQIWSADDGGWEPPAPGEVTVVRPAAHTTWLNPTVPAWTAPPGWTNPDPLWADVTGLFVMGRLGMDQSEHCHPADWTADAIPAPDATGSVTLLTTGGLVTPTASAVWCPPALTVEAFGLTPADGVIVAAADSSVRWSLGWSASGWQITVAGASHSIPDPGAVWPADVAMVVSGGSASVYRDGALVGSASVAPIPTATAQLSIGGDRLSGVWASHTLSSVRITATARYSGAYTPSQPLLSGAARLGGAGVVGYGAWTWYNDDRAIGAAGKLLFGATTKIGVVHAYDPATGRSRISRMPTWNERDDHNNPAFLTRTDGRQVIISTGHNINPFYRAISSEAGRVDDLVWDNVGPQIGLSRYSYSNIHQLEGLPGAPIFQFGRTSNPWRIYLARSDDGGTSWSFVGDLVAGTGQRPYLKTIKTGPSRIDILTSLAHPRDGNPSLRHLSFDGQVFRDAAANPLAAPGMFPLDFELATELWSTTTDGLNSWTGALTLIGRKLVAWGFAYKASSGVGDYGHYLRYALDFDEDPLVWRGEYVCDAGNALYGGEQHYSGGICSHPRDEDRAFASINHSGRDFQIVELQRGAGGAWSVTRQITDTPAGVRNIRPYATRDPDMLLWVTGRYATYNDYSCGIAALPL